MPSSQEDCLSDSPPKKSLSRGALIRNLSKAVLTSKPTSPPATSDTASPPAAPTRPEQPHEAISTSQTGSSSSDEAKGATAPKVEEPQELLLKPACDCAACHHWTTSPSWCTPDSLQFESASRSPRERKLPPFLTPEDKPRGFGKVCQFDFSALTRIQQRATSRILVHTEGVLNPSPISATQDSKFHESIKKALQRNRYNITFPLQSFAWPAIYRQLNVFVVDGAQSGKTLAYLPAVCSFALDKNERFKELGHFKGPLVVILCPTSWQCEEVFTLINDVLLKGVKDKPRVSIITYPTVNVKNVDILVTLPPTLIDCIKSRIFNLKRLCFVVLEEASQLLKVHNDAICKTFKLIDEVLSHRSTKNRVQLIATSSKWSSDLEKLLKTLNSSSLVCIGDNLEAALYGNIQFEMKFLMAEKKQKYLLSILKEFYEQYKTVVICSVDEIRDLSKFLAKNGIKTVCISESAEAEQTENEAYEMEWKTTPCGYHSVLLCTDFMFESCLTVNDAIWLVHYSFPPTWTMFAKRFSALTANLSSPLDKDDDKLRCKTFMLVDESSEEQMPKILHLLSRVESNLPETYQSYIKGFRDKSEQHKLDHNTPLCGHLKLFGKCRTALCPQRHQVTYDKDIQPLFQNGSVGFRIVNMLNVTKYRIQVLKHEDLHGNVTEFDSQNCFEHLSYDGGVEPTRVVKSDVAVGRHYALIAYGVSRDTYELCQVVTWDGRQADVCLVRCQDVTMRVSGEKLFELPAGLQVMEMYVSNLIPPCKDASFSDYALCMSRAKLAKWDYTKITFSGDITVHTSHTLWLSNVVHTVKLTDDMKPPLVRFDLAKELKRNRFVEVTETQVLLLRKLLVECGIELPEYEKPKQQKGERRAWHHLEAQRAFLQDDAVNEVMLSTAFSPDEFYVRLYKFDDLLHKLEKDITRAINTAMIPNRPITTATIGHYYLAPYLEANNLYGRVQVINVDEHNNALCFFVDYGDEIVLQSSALKVLPRELITKLPFQALQCKLHGIKAVSSSDWSEEATELLYRYMFEPNSDVFRSLYAKVVQHDIPRESIRSKVTYSIVLKDGFGERHSLLNLLFVEYGLGVLSTQEQVDDFEIPARIQREWDGDVEEDEEEMDGVSDNDFEIEMYGLDAKNEADLSQLLQYWQAEVGEAANHERLSIENGEETIDTAGNHGNCGRTVTGNEVPVQKTQEIGEEMGKNDGLTPEVFWSQTEKTVRMRILLIDVKDYHVNVVRGCFFTFSANLDDKKYSLKFRLFQKAKLAKHEAFGQEIVIVLNKSPSPENGENTDWLQLTATEKRHRNIHYEVPDNQLKDEKKRLLDLGIEEKDEESDPEDRLFYHVTSDLDSEYDPDLSSDSD